MSPDEHIGREPETETKRGRFTFNPAQKKFAIGAAGMALAIGYLVYSAFQSGAKYYHTVCEAKEVARAGSTLALRLEGKVVEGSLLSNPSNLELSFDLGEDRTRAVCSDNESIHVKYRGVTPDLMSEAITVIVEGSFDSSGVFIAERLLTSCPSRYDAAEKIES